MSTTNLNDVIINSLNLCYLSNDKSKNSYIHDVLGDQIKEIYIAYNYEELDSIIIEYCPDILIVNLNSKENYNGVSAIKALRDENKFIPIIIIVDQISLEIGIELLKQGVEECIIGEFQLEILKEIIVKTIKKYIYNTTILCKNRIMSKAVDKDLVNDLRKIIRSLLASYLKNLFGVGPKNILIEFSSNRMIISIMDGFTAYEKTLMENGYHKSLLESSRYYIYIKRKEAIEDSIKQLTSLNSKLLNINIDSDRLIDELIFEINIGL